MEPAGEDATTGRGGTTSVLHVLSSGGPVSPNFWGGDLGFVRGDVQEARRVSCGFPTEDNEAEGDATEGRDMADGVRR